MDNPKTTGAQPWLTLTEAAAKTGYSREALRLRVRRGKLKAQKGNDGTIRVDPAELATLQSSDVSTDDQEDVQDITLDVLAAAMADLRTDLDRTRTALETAQSDRLVDRGRAERAEAEAIAERARAERGEARIAVLEAALDEARIPWLIRVIRAIRGGR